MITTLRDNGTLHDNGYFTW